MRCKRMPFTVQSAPVRRVNTLCLHGKSVPLFFQTHPLGFSFPPPSSAKAYLRPPPVGRDGEGATR